MGMMINRRRAYGGKSLPYDYEVEYLQSTENGGQRIDSGILFDGVDNTDIIATVTTLSDTRFVIAGSVGISATNTIILSLEANSRKARVYYQTPNGEIYNLYSDFRLPSNTPAMLSAHYVKSIKVELDYDKTYSAVIPTFLAASNRHNINLFLDTRLDTSAIKKAGRIHSLQIIKDNITVRNFIPVVKDNVGYMYDKVSGRLFGNAGAGSFIVGPRVS